MPVGPARPSVNPADIPGWQTPSTKALETAAQQNLPLVVYFPGEGEGDTAWYGRELAEMAKKDAVFIRIPYNPDREKSLFDESVIPTSKLLTDNPSRDYKIPVGKATVLVTDSWGNEYFRFSTPPKHPELKGAVDKVADKVDATNKKLQKTYDVAKAAWDKKDHAGTLKAILKNFKEGIVGVSAQEETIRLYHELMDAVRAEVKDLSEKGGAEAEKQLKTMKTTYKGTAVAKDIDTALAGLKK
ncbi:MAG: hypothetical protein HS108_13765 [Planctomycetes bacterium]|nr:hypothetical protein [Planctomycetota bacterium]MCL4730893.1 hypothetical protein [Planctomycetota bacterium]